MGHVSVTVEGMSCAHCIKAVENAVSKVPGVVTSTVTFGTVAVDYTDGFDLAALKAGIEGAGYTVAG